MEPRKRVHGKWPTIQAKASSIKKRWGKALGHILDTFWWPPLALLAVALYWFHVAARIPKPTENTVAQYGVYGDSFGQLTSIFTALGFGGLVITLLLQQRQIRAQERVDDRNRKKDEKARYEETLFRLLDIYRQTLSEVRVGKIVGRDVLKNALDRVDKGLQEEGVNSFPRDLQGRRDNGTLSESDLQRIDYVHFRNFKIVGAEINPQARLVDTFEVLLNHMVSGAPGHLLIDAYRDLVFAQITFIECRYFFLVALSHPNRMRLRETLSKTGFFDRISRSQIHRIHRDMYKDYWGQVISDRESPPSIPMPPGQIKRALRAHKAAGGSPKTTYTLLRVRESQKSKGNESQDEKQ